MSQLDYMKIEEGLADYALLKFWKYNAITETEADILVASEFITLAEKHFIPVAYLQYAELTPKGFSRADRLDDVDMEREFEGYGANIENPVTKYTKERLLFNCDFVQQFVDDGLGDDLLVMTERPWAPYIKKGV